MQDLNSKITSKGNIDILINGSGINSSSNFLDIDLDDWNNVINSQLNSVFISCKVFGESMVKNKSGSIINISSTSAVSSQEPLHILCKICYNKPYKNIAREWADSGVRVNSLRPGFFQQRNKRILDKKELIIL